jgi:hypothetical protein
MAEAMDDYCIDPADEIKKARELTFEKDIPEKPTETTTERLMRPQSEQVEG